VRSPFRSRGVNLVLVSIVALIGGVALAYWQWTRYESASGTLQNLGYVLQWPLFGVFPGFMFWRIYRSAQREKAADAAIAAGPGVPEPRTGESGEPGKPADETVATEDWTSRWAYRQNRQDAQQAEDDPELRAYNDYLAKLSAREDRNAG
jgi:DNA-binding transcriptional regulator of glucitol operon